MINLIPNTTTQQGLLVEASLDKHRYPTAIKVTDQEFNTIAIERNSFRVEWNYVIKTRITTELFKLFLQRKAEGRRKEVLIKNARCGSKAH